MKKAVKILIIIVVALVALIIINGVRNYFICKELQSHFKASLKSTAYFFAKNTSNENQKGTKTIFAANTKFLLVDYNNGSTVYRYYDKEKGIVREYKDFNEKTVTEKPADSTEEEHWYFGNVLERSELKSFGPFMLCTSTFSSNSYQPTELYKVRKFFDSSNYELYDVITGAKIEKVKNNNSSYNIKIETGGSKEIARDIDYTIESLERSKEYKLVK